MANAHSMKNLCLSPYLLINTAYHLKEHQQTMLFFFVLSCVNNKIIFKIYGISFLATCILFLLFIYLNHTLNGHFWQTLQQSKSALTAEYCERDQVTHFFRQTINSYSNLMYFFLACVVINIGIHDIKNKIEKQNFIQQFPAITIFFGLCLLYLSFGSTFFHASLTWIGQRADMNATYSICLTLIAISICRYYFKEQVTNKNKALIITVLFVLILIFIQLHVLITSSLLLPILIGIALFITIKNYNNNRNKYKIQIAVLSCFFAVGAFILRMLDVEKIVCNPSSVFQAHALWHIFTGMSSFFLYWFYRSEQA